MLVKRPQDKWQEWEKQVLLFSALFFAGSFIKYFFGYDARWLDSILAVASPFGILGLGFVATVRGLKALVHKRMIWRGGMEFTGKKAQFAGTMLLFAGGIFMALGIRTLIWFVNHF
ncbi:hypothetical protein KJ765_06215 [Candidatus Micrarchaeota archaeon]|nr:hypothetical protein [Candidatus Micrarchaeota archaeon]